MKSDALIRVTFLTPPEGGRAFDIKGNKYGCPLFVDGKGFDCRFILAHGSIIELGRSYDISIKFLNPELALPHISKGKSIYLWEGKTIAKGYVLSI